MAIFLAVAKHLSYTKAAEELYMSQPAVSKNIKELEEEWQVRLFDRQGNRIALTEAGKIAYRHAIDINLKLENLKYELDLFNDSISGTLHVGASSTIAQYIIPRVIAAFKIQYPDTHITLISGNTAEINSQLQEDHIDLAITEGKRTMNHFDYIPFVDDEIALISKKNGALNMAAEISKDDLLSVPLVMRETGSGTREVFISTLQKMGLTLANLTIDLSLGSTESIKSYVLQADVAGVFSTSAIREMQDQVFAISRIAHYPVKRTFMFAAKHGGKHKLAQKFIRFSRRHHNLKA